jgi:thiosulfate/3-mercaptopyruvate sulfurtransferase
MPSGPECKPMTDDHEHPPPGSGCPTDGAKPDDTSVTNSLSNLVPLVGAGWLLENLNTADGPVICDVRWYLDGRSGYKAYLAGHVAGAIWVDLDRHLAATPTPGSGRHPLPEPEGFAASMSALGIGDYTSVVAYDDSGNVAAARLVWMLRALGHTAALLDGGLAAWQEATGLAELETTANLPQPASFTVKPWPVDRLADADEIAAGVPHLIDARAANRFRGDEEPIDRVGGHIPGALNLPWAENLDPGGNFLPVAELQVRFDKLGIHSGDDVVVYCGSGVSACHDLLALEIAGYGAGRLYPGSWSHWSSDETRPVETGDNRAGNRAATDTPEAPEPAPPPASPYGAVMSTGADPQTAQTPQPPQINTLAVDVGGTGIKASVLDLQGKMEHERVRVDTPYPLTPQLLVSTIEGLLKQLPPFDRVSVGFPGMVREGKILTAPHFVSPTGPGGKVSKELLAKWSAFDLTSELAKVTGKPTKVANDADVQGAAVISGQGLELVITLGTGVGTAIFFQGKLAPHLEFAHHPFHKDQTYNDQLGDAKRSRIGLKKWLQRVELAITTLHDLSCFDHCYVGGGNAARIKIDLGPKVTIVSNDAGILGGIKLWDV